MNRLGLVVFKQFVSEFSKVEKINHNIVKKWFDGTSFSVKFSKTIRYDFYQLVEYAKKEDPEDYESFKLDLDKIFKLVDDEKFKNKIMGVKK